jgi:hypothetical protein
MGTKRRRQEIITGLVVSGGGFPDKAVTSVSAGIALALDRASRLEEGTRVLLTEHGETLGAAIRGEIATEWHGAAFL